MTRVPTPKLNGSPQSIRPIASPVNHFVSPERVDPNIASTEQADAFVSALNKFNPALMGFLTHKQDQVDEESAESARNMRTKTALNYKEAVAAGKISASDNPFAIQAWKEQDGRVAADKYNQDLIVGLATGPFASSTDPADTDKYLSTFRTNWMEKHGIDPADRNLMTGFGKQAQAYEANARLHQASVVSNNLIQKAQVNTYHEITGAFDDAITRGLPATATADGLNFIMNRAILSGLSPKDANSLLLDAVDTKIREHGYMGDMRQVLSHIKTGSGFLGGTKEATKLLDEAERRIGADLLQQDAHAHSKEVTRRANVELDSSAWIFQQMFFNEQQGLQSKVSDPAFQERIFALSAVNPGKAEEFVKMVEASSKPKPRYDNPEIQASMMVDMFEGKLSSRNIISAVQLGQITSETAHGFYQDLLAKDARNLSARNRAEDQERITKPKDVFSIQAFSQMAASIKRDSYKSDPFGMNVLDPSVANRMNNTLTGYYVAAQHWRDANPDASPADQATEANRLRQLFLSMDPLLTDMEGKPKQAAPTSGPTVPEARPQPTSAEILRPTPGDPKSAAAGKGSAKNYFTSKAEWTAALNEFKTSKGTSKLNQIITQLGLSPEEVPDFLAAQRVLPRN